MQISLVFLCGFIAGLMYFTGLMITIRRIRWVRRPGYFLMASFVLRAACIGAVFFAVSNGHWQNVAACLIGFLLARQLMITLWKPSRGGSRKELEVKLWKS